MQHAETRHQTAEVRSSQGQWPSRGQGRGKTPLPGAVEFCGKQSPLSGGRLPNGPLSRTARPLLRSRNKLPEADTTITELLAAYLQHAQTYYVKAGMITSHVHVVRSVARFWKESFGAILVRKIKPSHLKAIQKRMVADGESRVLRQQGHQLFQVDVPLGRRKRSGPGRSLAGTSGRPWSWRRDALRLGRLSRSGRSKTPWSMPTLPYLPDIVADMVRLQRLTGCGRERPAASGHGRGPNRATFGCTGPRATRLEHHGRGRIIAIGPRARRSCAATCFGATDAYCFSPLESECGEMTRRRSTVEPRAMQAVRKPNVILDAARNDTPCDRACVARAVELATRTEACVDACPIGTRISSGIRLGPRSVSGLGWRPPRWSSATARPT